MIAAKAFTIEKEKAEKFPAGRIFPAPEAFRLRNGPRIPRRNPMFHKDLRIPSQIAGDWSVFGPLSYRRRPCGVRGFIAAFYCVSRNKTAATWGGKQATRSK